MWTPWRCSEFALFDRLRPIMMIDHVLELRVKAEEVGLRELRD